MERTFLGVAGRGHEEGDDVGGQGEQRGNGTDPAQENGLGGGIEVLQGRQRLPEHFSAHQHGLKAEVVAAAHVKEVADEGEGAGAEEALREGGERR